MKVGTEKPQLRQQRDMSIPAFCCFGIVDECMFRCQMCFKWKDDLFVKDKREPSFSDWKGAIKSLKKIVPNPETFVINFGGGEALLREDVLDLVRYAHEEGFITNIASNGWLIDDAMAKKIASSGLRTINLSLDSLNESVHDELRGKEGACRQVQSAIGLLRQYSKDLEIGICTVIYEKNFNDILPLVKWVNDNDDLNWIVFMAPMQPNNTVEQATWYKGEYSYLWPQNKRKARRLITYLKWLKWWGWKIQNPYYQLEAFRKYFSVPERFVRKSSCNMHNAVHVSAGGDIFLCFKWDRLGNIMHDSIEDVWYSSDAEHVRNNIEHCKDNCHFLLNCYFEKEYPFAFLKRFKSRL